MFIKRWNLFSEKEKEQEFEELMHSSYWRYLPRQTQLTLLRLLQPDGQEEKGAS